MAIRLKYPLILASSSPRRQALMAEARYVFETVVSTADEPALPDDTGASAAVWAETLAYFKARSIQQKNLGSIIIGADTVVAHSGLILGKPADELDARRILTTLFKGRNEVITGIAVMAPEPPRLRIAHVSTTLTLRSINPDEVEAYLASGAWRDKAGAYAIQEGGDRFVESIEGSHSNIVGLPMEKLAELLEVYQVVN